VVVPERRGAEEREAEATEAAVVEDEGEEEDSRGGVDIKVKRNLFIPSTAKTRSTTSPAKRPRGEAIRSRVLVDCRPRMQSSRDKTR
jgi:hypothetical protein